MAPVPAQLYGPRKNKNFFKSPYSLFETFLSAVTVKLKPEKLLKNLFLSVLPSSDTGGCKYDANEKLNITTLIFSHWLTFFCARS